MDNKRLASPKSKNAILTVEKAKKKKESIDTNRVFKFLLSFFGSVLLIIVLIPAIIQRSPFAFVFFFALMFFAIGMFAWIYNNYERIEELDKIINGGNQVPDGLQILGNKSYDVVKELFVSAGFVNIKCVPLNDLNTLNKRKENRVASITIGSDNIVICGERYDADAAVVIYYHGPK